VNPEPIICYVPLKKYCIYHRWDPGVCEWWWYSGEKDCIYFLGKKAHNRLTDHL